MTDDQEEIREPISVGLWKAELGGHQLTTGSSTASEQSVSNEFVPRKSRYYYITKAEIETYSNLGYLSTILFSFFGVIAGLPIGTYIALMQGGLSETTQRVLITVTWITSLIALIFLALSVVVTCWQQKNKKTWETTGDLGK